MFHSYKADIKKSLFSVRFFLSIFMVFIILIRALYNYNVFNDATGLDILYLSTIPMSLSGFTPFAAIFPLLPYSTSFCDDYNSGYIKAIVTRTGLKRYIRTKILSVSISGALAIGIPFLIVFAIITGIGEPTTSNNLSEAFRNTIWEPYASIGGGTLVLAAKLVLGIVFGAVWSLVGLAFSSWITNRYVTLIAPFVLYQALWVLLANTPFNPLYMLRGDFGVNGEFLGSYIYILLYQAIWIILSIFAIRQGIKRRMENV